MLRFRGLLTTLFHLLVIGVSFATAFWLRFDFSFESVDLALLTAGLAIAVPVKILVFTLGGLQSGWWRYAGLADLSRLFQVNFAASALSTAGIFIGVGPAFPRSVFVIDFLVCFLVTSGGRFSVRLYNEALKSELRLNAHHSKSILIYGAGAAGRTLLREIRTNPALGFHVVGFIDDNPALRSSRVMDVPVLGMGRNVAAIVDRRRWRGSPIEDIIIAMPSATGREMREAHANCRAAGVTCRTVPGMGDLLTGKYLSSQIRNISVDDLLGREQVRLEEDRIQGSIEGKVVMITGAAGSIGSELCRQTARFKPGRLIALDQAESDLFEIDRELREKHPELEIVPVVGDIRDAESLEEVVRAHAVDSIYHAAAYKHVPLMEQHILEAVRNNVIGTWNLARVAEECGVKNFLMISSDKAVNPTSVMGATKRIAEMIVSVMSAHQDNGINWVSVRFGNVLGSNGSVVPIFRAQIAAGGPVTVTHPEMRRYFMSIPEAVQLVLQASTMGKGSEVFVLDMGESVRILDLAHNMIHLAGLVPDEDIEVRITGLRPGEKLYEEVTASGENVLPTYHEKIRIFKGSPPDAVEVANWLDELQVLLSRRNAQRVLRHLAALVPEYRSQQAEKAAKPVSEKTQILRAPTVRTAASGR